jgi:hypothetical protein
VRVLRTYTENSTGRLLSNPRFPAPPGTWEATGRRQTVMSNSFVTGESTPAPMWPAPTTSPTTNGGRSRTSTLPWQPEPAGRTRRAWSAIHTGSVTRSAQRRAIACRHPDVLGQQMAALSAATEVCRPAVTAVPTGGHVIARRSVVAMVAALNDLPLTALPGYLWSGPAACSRTRVRGRPPRSPRCASALARRASPAQGAGAGGHTQPTGRDHARHAQDTCSWLHPTRAR